MKNNIAVWSLCAVMATGVSYATPAAADAHGNAPTLGHATVLSGLESPWDMAFLDDGTMFFTEKCRGLSVRLPSGDVKALLGMKDIVDQFRKEVLGLNALPNTQDTRHLLCTRQ